MDEPIVLSAAGHMLVDAYNEVPANERKRNGIDEAIIVKEIICD
jgi:hypothetical protein